MNTLVKKDKVYIKRGTVIEGRWHRNRYKVIRMLGSGTVGTVYLCSHNGQFVALKISEQSMSMSAEVQVLKTLGNVKVQDSRLGPYLMDVDDWLLGNGKQLSFYVMEYIKGTSLHHFIHQNGTTWVSIFLLHLLEQLEQIHRAGYVFGDLKSENIIVESSPPTIRLIDVGGTTKIGRSVKEYTNFYDRAYWRLGTRLAEPSYDLFAVVMVVLAIYYPKKFTRVKQNYPLIKRKILQVKSLEPFAPILLKAIEGKYMSAKQMHDDLLRSITKANKLHTKQTASSSWIELLLLATLSAAYFGIYFYITNI